MKIENVVLGIVCVVLILIVLIAVGQYASDDSINEKEYYTSEYSKYCYPKTIAQTRIKERIYFETLEDCGKPLPSNVLPAE